MDQMTLSSPSHKQGGFIALDIHNVTSKIDLEN